MDKQRYNMWKNVFYIVDLNDNTHKRKANVSEHWYQLRITPYCDYDIRHFVLSCGGDLNVLLQTVSKYVSIFPDVNDFIDVVSNNNDGLVISGKTQIQSDNYYDNYADSRAITKYNRKIHSAIKEGLKQVIYKGNTIKAIYHNDSGDYEIKGNYSEWFENLLFKLSEFDGSTKKELYHSISEEIDAYCLNDIFAELKKIGVYGIRDMKTLDICDWLEILVPLVDLWEME